MKKKYSVCGLSNVRSVLSMTLQRKEKKQHTHTHERSLICRTAEDIKTLFNLFTCNTSTFEAWHTSFLSDIIYFLFKQIKNILHDSDIIYFNK